MMGDMQGGEKNEREFYKEIIRRAKRVRERAAEQLSRSRASRAKQPKRGKQPGASKQQPRSRPR